MSEIKSTKGKVTTTNNSKRYSDEESNTSVHIAAACGNIEELKKYIQISGKIDTENYLGWTPLMMAARNGHLDIVKLLIENNADASKKNHFGSSVFLMAVSNGNIEIIEFILQHLLSGGVSRQIIECRLSPICISILFKHDNVVQYLIAKRFNVNWANILTSITPLMYSAVMKNVNVFNQLISNGANLYAKNINRQSAQDITALMEQYKQQHVQHCAQQQQQEQQRQQQEQQQQKQQQQKQRQQNQQQQKQQQQKQQQQKQQQQKQQQQTQQRQKQQQQQQPQPQQQEQQRQQQEQQQQKQRQQNQQQQKQQQQKQQQQNQQQQKQQQQKQQQQQQQQPQQQVVQYAQHSQIISPQVISHMPINKPYDLNGQAGKFFSPQPTFLNLPPVHPCIVRKSSNFHTPHYVMSPCMSPINPAMHAGQIFFPPDFHPQQCLSLTNYYYPTENSIFEQNIVSSPNLYIGTN